MIDDVRQRIDRWLDGDLPADDEAALARDIGDPGTLAHLADRAVLHGLLGAVAIRAAVPLEPSPRRRTVVWSVAWASVALAVFLVVGSLLVSPSADAGGARLVQEALDRFHADVDRRYSVRIEPARPRLWAAWARPLPPPSTLWVREGRFVQTTEVGGRSLAWGRDGLGTVWFRLSPRSVALFGPDEIPDTLRDVCDLRSLDLATLLGTLLDGFDLRWAAGVGDAETIVARPRDEASRIGTVRIVIERESLRVRSVSVERRFRGRTTATVRFTLDETAARDGAFYDWQSHVEPAADVLDDTSVRGARRDLLEEFLRMMRQEPAAS